MSKISKFAAWQEANQLRREKLIAEYLAYLDKTRVRVRNTTDLADLVARHLEQTEGKPCNKSTLLRNVRYKAKLLSYQAVRGGQEGRKKDRHRIDDPVANAMVTTAKLEAGNLKREVERLRIYIDSLETQIEELTQGGGRRQAQWHVTDTSQDEVATSDYEFKFIRTCQALRSLLSQFNVFCELDTNNAQILDRSKRRNNVLVDKELAGPFVEWINSIGGMLKRTTGET